MNTTADTSAPPTTTITTKINTGGQLESWLWIRTGTISVIGGPVSVVCRVTGRRGRDHGEHHTHELDRESCPNDAHAAQPSPDHRHHCTIETKGAAGLKGSPMGVEIAVVVIVVIAVFVTWKSLHSVGATEVGLVAKRFGFRKLGQDNPVAFRGEAGYQATLLMPGLRFKLWPMFGVKKFPWVQVPAGEIGVVIAQVGSPLPIGAKSAVYRPELANFSNLHTFVELGGQKGVQRPVLPPGTLVPVHPVAFMVLTPQTVYGLPVSPDLANQAKDDTLSPESFGLSPDQLRVVIIAPDAGVDLVGVVTALEGEPLPSGDIASRLGGFEDVAAIEETNAGGSTTTTDAQLIDLLLGSKNTLHNNYQDFQAFLDAGGKIGLQHDTLLYGAYLLNPFLVRVDLVPMLVVNQGEVAVIKGFVGPANRRHVGRRVQVRIDRPARSPWHLAGAPADREVRDQPACVRRRDRADLHPHVELGRRHLRSPRPRLAALVHRGQEPGGLRLSDRSPGADPRAGHEGPQGDLDGRARCATS